MIVGYAPRPPRLYIYYYTQWMLRVSDVSFTVIRHILCSWFKCQWKWCPINNIMQLSRKHLFFIHLPIFLSLCSSDHHSGSMCMNVFMHLWQYCSIVPDKLKNTLWFNWLLSPHISFPKSWETPIDCIIWEYVSCIWSLTWQLSQSAQRLTCLPYIHEKFLFIQHTIIQGGSFIDLYVSWLKLRW